MHRWILHLFLWIGLLAGIAVRSLMLLNRVNSLAAIWVWRFAMTSYTVFFGYRYLNTRERRYIVVLHKLAERIAEAKMLDSTIRE